MKLSTKCNWVKIYLCIVREPHVYVPSTCLKRHGLLLFCPLSSCRRLSRCLRQVVHIEKATLWWLKMCVNLFIVLINVNSLQLPAIKGRRTSCCMQHTMWQPVALVRTVRMINAACQPTQWTKLPAAHRTSFCGHSKTKIPQKLPKKAKREARRNLHWHDLLPYTIVQILLRASLMANHLFNVCTIFHFNFRFSAFLFFHNSFDWKN